MYLVSILLRHYVIKLQDPLWMGAGGYTALGARPREIDGRDRRASAFTARGAGPGAGPGARRPARAGPADSSL